MVQRGYHQGALLAVIGDQRREGLLTTLMDVCHRRKVGQAQPLRQAVQVRSHHGVGKVAANADPLVVCKAPGVHQIAQPVGQAHHGRVKRGMEETVD